MTNAELVALRLLGELVCICCGALATQICDCEQHTLGERLSCAEHAFCNPDDTPHYRPMAEANNA